MGGLWHPACQPPATSGRDEALWVVVICNLSCRCLLSPALMLTSFFFMVDVDHRAVWCLSWATTSSRDDAAWLSATPWESLMWNIRPHSCCRTPGGVAAGEFSWSVGKKKKVKKWDVKSLVEPVRMSKHAAGGIHVGSQDFGCIFTFFYFKGPSKCFLNFNHMRFETCILQEDPLLCLNFYNKTTGLI